MKLLIFRKSGTAKKPGQYDTTAPDNKLEYFRKLLLDHLDSLESGESPMAKGGKGLPVGTVRDRKGGKRYIKIAPGKWRPKYDSESRGSKMAVAAIRRKIVAAKDEHEMMQIILENRDRFSDKDGHPLPFVMELHNYIKSAQESREKAEPGKNSAEGKPQKKRIFYEPGKPKRGQAAAARKKENLDKKEGIKEWEQKGADAFKEGKPRRPYLDADLMKLSEGVKIGSPESEANSKKTEAWLRGWDKASVRADMENWKREAQLSQTEEKPGGREAKEREIYNDLARERYPAEKFLNEIKRTVKKYPDKTLKNVAGNGDMGLENAKKEATRLYQKGHGAPIKNKRMREQILEEYSMQLHQIENADAIQNILEAELDRRGISDEEKNGQESSQAGENSSDFEALKSKYQSAKAVEGDEDEIQAGKEIIIGKWKLVDADTPAASHDETTFQKTPGFPMNKDGSTINDRDYEQDRAAQEAVLDIASDYDMRALSFDSPVIVTTDGIVISGNNRTMSSKVAARKGTDKKYIEALKKKSGKFGFTAEQVGQFKHPRIIFEIGADEEYSTRQFAKFNESGKKAMNPIESAVKVSKMMKSGTVESVAGKISEFDTLGELYADKKAANNIFNTLQQDGIIGQFDRPQYVTDDGITGAGKEFLETVLIGSVINERNIRELNREGCKSIRQKLVRAITPLIENKGMSGYSINKELNEAVDIAMQVAIHKDKFKDVTEYSKQQNMFGNNDKISIELAKRLEGTQKEFAEFMQSMNGGLKYAANGEADIFLGEVEGRDDILNRLLNTKETIKKAIDGALRFFHGLSKGRGSFDREKVILNRAGEDIEAYRWVAKQPEVIVHTPDEKAIAPHVELIQEAHGGEKTIAVDFDGVINSYKSGWKGPTETDEPVWSAAESISRLFNRGNKLIIFSTRAQTPEGTETIREYLRKHTENELLANSIEITDQKPIADIYIDDRAISFTGNWEETMEKIDTFKPWTEKQIFPISYEVVDLPDGIYHGKRAAYEVRLENEVSFKTITGIKCSWAHPIPYIVEIKAGVPYPYMEKSLTWSGYPLQGWAKVQGMDISIENRKGSTRSGTDKDGHEWETEMHFDYGYIRGTVGVDKDHLDAYVGPNPESEMVYIVNQNDPVTGYFDEQKVMLGFGSEAEAKTAYLKQYDRPGFFGNIVKMDIDTFKEEAFDPANKGKPLQRREK